MMITISDSTARHIYEILIEECGVNSSYLKSFVEHQIAGCREFRIGGLLGFGGKFWNSGGKLYVSCYPEDSSEAVKKMIDKTNFRLEPFYKK